jgi:arsenate reductase
MENAVLYWLPNCSTCKKAKNFLEEKGIREIELRDVKEKPLTRLEVEDLAGLLGGAENLFSRRAIKYRELKLNERGLSEREMLDFMTREYTLLKRPVLVTGGTAVAGFNEKFWNRFLEENYYEPRK